jgi:hypothetical protein
MISAKLIKALEKKGFSLSFPSYSSTEELIKEILTESNERLYTAIPLLLAEEFNYDLIALDSDLKNKFDKILNIAEKIFITQNIDFSNIEKTILEKKIRKEISNSEFEYYLNSFRESIKNLENDNEDSFREEIKLRNKLSTNKSLSIIFAPAKLRIMEKVFNHMSLTNTELKYYYKSIKPINAALLNIELQRYIRIIESNKKGIIK